MITLYNNVLFWNRLFLLIAILCGFSMVYATYEKEPMYEADSDKGSVIQHTLNEIAMHNVKNKQSVVSTQVEKKVLKNGMTILVLPVHDIPMVSLQLWYKVGSKDESTREKGIAHLIEHMIFKGTSGKDSLKISESDINNVVHMLSGSCNAFTTQDYTGYLFDMPSHHWRETLPIMADCMKNCAFKDDHLNSEMKAVIQELKMRRDNYLLSLAEEMMCTIFADHPYHYPIIGFKQDLWNVHGDDLRAFYKKHYHPNNATLVIVGDVQPHEVFALAKKHFGDIAPVVGYTKEAFYYNKDIASKSVTLYRDVTQPMVAIAYVVPGIVGKNKSVIDVISWILCVGKGSRLYKKIVNEQKLATSLMGDYWDHLFDHALLLIAFQPNRLADSDMIIDLIQQEIDDIVTNGVPEAELMRAIKKARMNYYGTLESMQQQASDIGKYFVATGDENYVFDYLNESPEYLQEQIRSLLNEYCRQSVMHTGKLVPLSEKDTSLWVTYQHISDQEDARILSARKRTTPVDPPSYAKKIKVQQPHPFNFPKAQEVMLSNGLKVLYYHNPRVPKIHIELRVKAQGYYDPQDKPGLYGFMTQMMTEGTKKYTATEFTDELESRGMGIGVSPSGISMNMLSVDLPYGLSLLRQMLMEATFDEHEIEKVRSQLLANIKNFWDNPSMFATQLIKEDLYKGHPYSKNLLGTEASIMAITKADLIGLYKKFMVPEQATIAIVGDLRGYDIPRVVEQELGSWQGKAVSTIDFPSLATVEKKEINYPINRDQVVLCFAGLSIDRKHPNFDKLLLFDQILGGGVLGSMKSRLFALREQSGLFYGINGSLVAQANEQPGMILIKTLVSLDRLQEAEKAIKNTLATVADVVTEHEFSEAKNAIINALSGDFESNASMASAFLLLNKYGFASDYFDKRATQLSAITVQDMQQAVKAILCDDTLCVLKIGRINASPHMTSK